MEAKAIFNINGIYTTILCQTNNKFKDIFQKLQSKINKNINEMYFLYNGAKINEESKYEEVVNNEDKINKSMNIIGYEINQLGIIENTIINSPDIICKEC